MVHGLRVAVRPACPAGSGHLGRAGDVGEPHRSSRRSDAPPSRESPSGHRGSGERAERSTTTRAVGREPAAPDQQRRARPRARPPSGRTAGRAAPGRTGPPAPGAGQQARSTVLRPDADARAARRPATRRCGGSPRPRRAAARRARPTAAPRLAASSPSAPDPAYRSSTRAPGSDVEVLEPGEQRLADPVARRPGAAAGRRCEPAAAGAAGDDPGHGVVILAPGRRPAPRRAAAATRCREVRVPVERRVGARRARRRPRGPAR